MIESTAVNQVSSLTKASASEKKQTLVWRHDERMGGRIPVWTADKTSKETIASDLSMAERGIVPQSFEGALAYADQNKDAQQTEKPFGIGDVIDMVNPLQHIPVIGHIYREISGDEISGIARVVGGSVYGGFGGLASSLADTIVTQETGEGVAENAVKIVMRQSGEEPRTASIADRSEKSPEQSLEKALNEAERPLKVSEHAISFIDLGGGKQIKREYVDYADGRTAGKRARETLNTTVPVHMREPITQVTFDPMPLLQAQENAAKSDTN